jgi:hypothetical protein
MHLVKRAIYQFGSFFHLFLQKEAEEEKEE